MRALVTLLFALVALAGAVAPAQAACDRATQPICDALVEALEGRLELPAGAVVTVDDARVQAAQPLPPRYRVTDIDLAGLSSIPGRTLVVRVTLSGGAGPLWVRAGVSVRAPAVVARRRLERGQPLTSGDVELAMVDVTGRELLRVEGAVGRVLRRPVAAGETIQPELLRLPDAVRRGERVTALLSGAGFSIKTSAEVLQRGSVGDHVPVRVSASGKIVRGRVVGPRLVEVQQ